MYALELLDLFYEPSHKTWTTQKIQLSRVVKISKSLHRCIDPWISYLVRPLYS